jgi:hypothetical protein
MVDGNWYGSYARNEERRPYDERSQEKKVFVFHKTPPILGLLPLKFPPPKDEAADFRNTG